MHPKQWLSHAIGTPVNSSRLSMSKTVKKSLSLRPGNLHNKCTLERLKKVHMHVLFSVH